MNKTFRLLAAAGLIVAAAFAVSACKWGDKQPAPAPVVASSEPASPTSEASATPPASGAVVEDTLTSTAPASDTAKSGAEAKKTK